MMKKMKELVLLTLALLLALAPCCAELVSEAEPQAEAQSELASSTTDEDLYPQLLPVIDAGAAAEMAEDSSLEGLYVGMRPMDMELSEDGSTVVVIGDVYAAAAQLDTLTAAQYGEVRWLDAFAVAVLSRDGQGWKLESLELDAEEDMADVAENYFSEDLKEHADTAAGWSVQYPAVLGDLTQKTDSDGCGGWGASLKDGTASFFVGCTGNEKGQTNDTIAAERQKAHPSLARTDDALTGVTRLVWTEGKTTTAEYWIATGSTLYHAVLTWDESLNADFTRYLDPMMNSFCADELGIG